MESRNLVPKLAPRGKQPWVPTSVSPTKGRTASMSHHSSAWGTVQDFLDRSQHYMHDPARRMVTEAEAVRALKREHEAVLLELGSRKHSLPRAGNTATIAHVGDPAQPFPTVDGTYFSTRSEFPSNWTHPFPPTPLDARVPPPPPPPPPVTADHALQGVSAASIAAASQTTSPTKRTLPTYASPTKRPASSVRRAYPSHHDSSRWSATLESARDDLLDEGISGIYLVNRTLDPPPSPSTASRDRSQPSPTPSIILPSLPDHHISVAKDEDMVVDPLDAIGRFREECGLGDLPREHAVEPEHYYSGYFQATASSHLIPLVGGRTPDQDDPPVKVRITASVAKELQSYKKPIQLQTRVTYYDEDSMALNKHLHAGCRPNMHTATTRRTQSSMALKSHVVDVKDDGLTPAWAPKAARASAYRTKLFRV